MKIYLFFIAIVLISGATLSLAETNQSVATIPIKNSADKVTWFTSFDDAKAAATQRKAQILADFSGSDWCGWCIKLDKEVFSTDVFQKFAAENLVLLLVDFPRNKPQSDDVKKQNNALAEKFNVQGFPTILLLDAEGKRLAQTGYLPGGGDNYVKHLQKLLKNKGNKE